MSGLEIMDFADNNAWKSVPEIEGTLKVLVGNHLEVLSNGLYRSVFHRVTPSDQISRVSKAAFLAFPWKRWWSLSWSLLMKSTPKHTEQVA
ncbi:unnamed protein product [Prunus armeniaca]|uniref:Isopenicillin N synthase-like Fe(2+) 2OG dioxygenase domain-containing protein n=1 Tax=Prunus armeniaca TaxID=36596 RepID=A0A6J5UTR8_PRUAR|nr:unnamed protein product [Prunus armeniaca]CAB4309901.1 unnamed protein product [Prunus armeniaca]